MRFFTIGNAGAVIKFKSEIVIMGSKAEADIKRVFRLNMRFQSEGFARRADKISRRAIWRKVIRCAPAEIIVRLENNSDAIAHLTGAIAPAQA